MTEVWKDIPTYGGVYQASSMGRIRSLDRKVKQLNRYGRMMVRSLKGCVLSLQKCSNDYLFVQLGKSNMHLAHRLIAITFIAGDADLQVNHKNGNRQDNRVDNLEWVTCSENHLHSYKDLPRKKHALIKKVVLVKDGQILSFDSVVQASKYLGVVPGSVASAATRFHRCLGFEVSYG